MSKRKEEGGKDRCTLARADGSLHPAIGCGNQYSISVSALQEEVGEKFAPKKVRSLRLAELYEEMGLLFSSRAGRVRECGSYLDFRLTEDGQKKLFRANFCRDRFCPMCNWRRSLKIFGQVSEIMNVLESQKYRFLFLTLTVRNCDGKDFPKTVQMIFDGWRRFYHDYFRKGKAFRDVVCGSFRSLEVTINKKTGQFHPHLHIILAVRPSYFRSAEYITQKEWAEIWRRSCGLDYKPIVDIRSVKPKKDKRTGEMSVASAVAEVSKYAAKDDDYLNFGAEDADQFRLFGNDRAYYLRTLMEGLTGRRLIGLTGCFKEVKARLGLDDVESGDLVHVEADEEIREDIAYLIVHYQWRNGVYVETIERPSWEDVARRMGPIEPTPEEMEGL